MCLNNEKKLLLLDALDEEDSISIYLKYFACVSPRRDIAIGHLQPDRSCCGSMLRVASQLEAFTLSTKVTLPVLFTFSNNESHSVQVQH